MAQIGAPISDITFTNWTGGFGNIDEASPSDGDFNYTIDKPVAEDIAEHAFTGSLLDPQIGSGTTEMSYRHGCIDGGSLAGSGSITAKIGLYQGTTLIQEDSTVVMGTSWVTGVMDFSGNIGSITDFSDLRIRITWVTGGGGSPTNRRGMGISWAKIELPDVVEPSGIPIQVNIGDVWKVGVAMKINIGDVWKDVVSVKQNIGDVWKDVY